MAKGCVYIPKTGKDAGKVFGSKESLAAHMNYTPALTDLMAKFEQSGGKADIDSVTKWLSDNGYLKEKPAVKPSRRERLAKMFEEPKVEVTPVKEEKKGPSLFESEIISEEKPSRPQKQKPFSGIKNLFKKGFGGRRVSEREAQSLNRELNTLIDRAEKENGVQRDRLNHATWRTNDGYTITEFFENKRDGTRIVTPEGEEINLYGNKYKNESGQEISYFPEAGKPAITEAEKPTIEQAEVKPAEQEAQPSGVGVGGEVEAATKAEKPKTKLEEKKALDQSVNELINKKNRYNKIAKTRKPLAGKLLNEIKDEAERLGFALSPALGGNIKLVSKKDGKVVARRSVDRGFNKERNEKVKMAKSMAGDFMFGLRGSVLLYFLNKGKVNTKDSELGEKSEELKMAKKAGLVSDTGRSIDLIAIEDIPELGGVVFDEQEAITEIQDVLASFENRAQMEDELVDMLDKLNGDMEEAARYRSASEMNEALDSGQLDEDELSEYYESLSEDEKVKSIEDYEKFYQEIEREQPDQEGKGGAGVSPSEGTTQEIKEQKIEPLLAPNGKPSKLDPEQYKYVRTKAFKDWFGDWENDPENASKVVDENGEPLVVYHASMEAFTTFEIKPPKSERDKTWREKNTSRRVPNGFYFTDNKEAAMEFAVQKEGSTLADESALLDLNLIPAFLNIKKPDQKYLKEPPYYLPNLLSQNKYILEDLETGYIDGLISGYGYLYLQSSVKLEEDWNGESRPEEIWGKEFIVTSNSQIKIADPELLIKDGPNEGLTRTDTAAGPFVSESGNIPYSERGGVRGETVRAGGVGNTVKAVWNKYKQIKFNGSTKVKDADDVAHIMRKLEDKSVEHAFAVHVDKDGNSHIQFLGMGGPTSTIVDSRLILAGVKKFKSKKVYLVHNHPSGSLVASRPDVELTNRVDAFLSPLGIQLEHVIMDTYKKEYVHLYPDDVSFVKKRDISKETIADYNKALKAEMMDEQKILSEPVKSIWSSMDVSQFLMQLRFTALPKHGMLLLNNKNEIIGNYIFKKGFNYKETVSFVADSAIGTGIIFYSNQDQFESGIKPMIKSLEAAEVKVFDYVIMNSESEGVRGYYQSYADENKLRETQAEYGTNSIPNELREPTPKTSAELQQLMEDSMDAVDSAIAEGKDAQSAINDLIGNKEWYFGLTAKQKEQFDEILQDEFGVTPTIEEEASKTEVGESIKNIVDNYYKLKDGDRSARAAINQILGADPKLKYIYDNISKINKQLQDAGVITDKTDGCP